MPRTIFDKPKPRPNKMLMLIRETARVQGVKGIELGRMAGVGETTMYNRLNHPEKFTLEELRGIRRGLAIPKEDFLQHLDL